MTNNLEIDADEVMAERYIILDAMDYEDLSQEYVKQFGKAPEASTSRLDLIDLLLSKLQSDS